LPRRSSIGCGSLAFTAPLLSFTVSSATPGSSDRGMSVRFRPDIRPRHLHLAFGAPDARRDPPSLPRRTRTHALKTRQDPAFLGLDPSKSPSPASRGGPLPRRPETPHRAMAANPRHRVPPSWFCTTSAVFSAPRGPGLLHPGTGHGVRCVSRPPSDGCRSSRGGRQSSPFPKETDRPGFSQRTTLRRFDPRRQPNRIAAVVALLSFLRAFQGESRRACALRPLPREWATGFRRAPGGRGLTAVPSGCISTAGSLAATGRRWRASEPKLRCMRRRG
jgi:hypothetical protein